MRTWPRTLQPQQDTAAHLGSQSEAEKDYWSPFVSTDEGGLRRLTKTQTKLYYY